MFALICARVMAPTDTVLTSTTASEAAIVARMVFQARDRRSRGVGPEAPFLLVRSTGGGLFLEDPQTGRRIGLDAFGPTNSGAFARLLDARPGSYPTAPATTIAQGG